MILVEGDRPGLSVAGCVETLGMRMTTVADLHFDNVQVPLSNLIGKEGQGLKQLLAFTSESRVLIAGLALGIGQGALDRTIDYVKQREQFGKKIGRFQVTAHKLADMALGMEQARSLTYQAAWQLNQRKPDQRLMSMAKLAATRAALAVAHEAIQLHGGYGYTTEYEVERFCRDAKTLEIMGGTTGPIKDDIAAAIIRKIK
jgi:alkylation response protein AidB-like acyl-CoA dehydrogenase